MAYRCLCNGGARCAVDWSNCGTLVPLRGALLGFGAYATYHLTQLAALKAWPYWLAALDMA
ncbi:DUF2177 family protein [Rhodoferax aquaticus]|uniref:DUF2177 family protein n=1 Tax=Rhodoferax aquaticus TaxID=2527691 RepID=A0A515EW04_9BURK|nr:DUF2177 family protein [Rhodoferax aquaticus]